MFANAAKNTNIRFPSKDQAIIVNAIEGVPLQDHILAIGNIIKPQHIKYVSRMSNNRIGIFLSNKELVEYIVEKHQIINVNGIETEIRKLINPAKRLTISNACPSIPHSVIESALIANGVQPVSPMTYLRAGITDPQYAHVLSSRRQIYIATDKELSIPETLIIAHDDTNYRIFITSDGLVCRICKQHGHIANRCPSSNNSQTIEINLPTPLTVEKSLDPDHSFPALPNTSSRPPAPNMPVPEHETTKPIPTPIIDPIFQTPSVTTRPAKKQKRRKSSSSQENLSETLEQHLDSLKEVFDKPPPFFPLTYDRFKDFFENVQGARNAMKIALNYTDDLKSLKAMITYIHPYATKNLKNRLTRIKNKLNKDIADETGDDTLSSTDDQCGNDNTMEY